jgi:hypothetical protein
MNEVVTFGHVAYAGLTMALAGAFIWLIAR